jgi:long-subunit fatty acid transport protein
MDYIAKMKALSPEKNINKKEEKNKLAQFDFALFIGLPQFNEIVIQKDGIAPKLSSSIFTLSTNYRILDGLSFYGGITRQNIAYEAGAITSSNKRVIPDPGNPAYILDAVTIDQLIWGLNTGLSYDFLLKNNWILSFGTGVDWILSGKQNNSYCFPGIGYLKESRVYENREAKIMTPQNAYFSIGADIPVYKQLSAAVRIKKYLGLIDKNWIVPDYSTEFGLRYNFY